MLRKTTLQVLFVSLLAILGASPAGDASVGINSWTRTELEGGSINASAIDPETPTTLYAGTEGGGVSAIQQVYVVTQTWHVATNGSDVTGNGSEANPFATIQHGIDLAANGDTVLVHPGVYRENINFNGKNITVGSLFVTTGDEDYILQTVIDGRRNDHVVALVSGETAAAQTKRVHRDQWLCPQRQLAGE